MIIQIGTKIDESRILWKHKETDEWTRADIDDLIRAYESMYDMDRDLYDIMESIEKLPSAEPKTGEWIQKNLCADRFCSCCDYVVWDSEAEEYNYCPNCGAKMRGEEE